MKKIITIVLVSLILSACADKKATQKAILDSIMTAHDKVMGADETLMKNKMLLDTLAKQATGATKDSVMMMSKSLGDAETNMDNWMHKFDPDQKNKSADETIKYFTEQKKQIMAIDSQINIAITQSGKYLSKIKNK